MLPLGAISLTSLFSLSIDRLIVTFFMGIDNFALYDRGAMRITIISTLSITVGAVILKKLLDYYGKMEFEKLLDTWHLSIKKIALIVFPSFIYFGTNYLSLSKKMAKDTFQSDWHELVNKNGIKVPPSKVVRMSKSFG